MKSEKCYHCGRPFSIASISPMDKEGNTDERAFCSVKCLHDAFPGVFEPKPIAHMAGIAADGERFTRRDEVYGSEEREQNASGR